MSLLRDSEFDVRVFASPVSASAFPLQPWHFPTYTLFQPDRAKGSTNEVKWLLPNSDRLRPLTNWARNKFRLSTRWLSWVISTWKPDVIHTLRLNPEGELTWEGLKGVKRNSWPKWVLSSWGQELSVEISDPYIREGIITALRNSDGFIADCQRDLRNAVGLGLPSSSIALDNTPPANGGLDLNDFTAQRSGEEKRNVIMVPKAYTTFRNKPLCILEALHLADDALEGHEVHLLMCSDDVQTRLREMPESFQQRCHVHGTLSECEFISMLGRARTMIAPSLSEGTPISMLDAMATGALPLMSPLDSIQDWIEDGKNGLLAPALQPDRIAAAIRRALVDDELWQKARDLNWNIISKRANRGLIRPQILEYYRSLIS
jgi:glycosyltransferase involved in cell wall biosynthesis